MKTTTILISSMKIDMGLIAQDVKEVFPEAVSTSKDGLYSVAYSKLIAPIIESLRELFNNQKQADQKIAINEETLQEQGRAIAQLEEENQELRDRLDRLENLLRESATSRSPASITDSEHSQNVPANQ